MWVFLFFGGHSFVPREEEGRKQDKKGKIKEQNNQNKKQQGNEPQKRKQGPNLVDVQSSEDEDQPGERRVAGNGLEPIVVDVEQHHLRLGCLEDEVSELLHLETRLERQLQL